MARRLAWSVGNGKLKKTGTISFNLPAFRSEDGFTVCPQAGTCASVCYARQGRYVFPEAKATREFNLAIIRADLALFERLATADLDSFTARSVRIHDSGDFFSQAYLDCWFRIIAAHPRKRFYCYTKSLHLDWRAKPRNLQRVQSMGGKLDKLVNRRQSHTRIFATAGERRAAGYCDGNATDRPAQNGVIRIGFVYHGSTRLSPAMARVLRQEVR